MQVTTLATAGGSWSALTGGTYTFTPNADNANILYTDIEYRLLGYNGFTRGNVRIVTTNGTGTEGLTTNGKSTIISNSDFINSNGTLVTNQRQLLNKFGGFSVASPGTQVGNVNIATLITAANQQSTAYTFTVDAAGDINVSGAINLESSSSGGTTNRASMSVVLTAAGNISITSPITTNASNNNGASGIGPAGSISLTATGNVYTSSAGTLNAIGGYSSWSGTYSRGGDVSISGASVSLGGSISNGGRGGYNAIGVTTGDITISTTNTATTVGLNDGQVSGVITGGNFTKSGSGTFILKSVNTYIGTTTVSGGTLQLGASNALPTSTALTVSGGAVFDLFSFSPTVGSIAGGGTIRSSSGSSTPVLTTGSDGTSTTFSGVIENGSATSVSLIKTGGGVLTLTGSSSYTGSTSINTGVINIRHANALGVSSTTTVASGATLQLQGGIAVGALPLTLKGVGVSSVGALRNISGNNTWGGTITTETSAVRIYSDAGTLTLSGSTAISSPTNIGVLFWGSGHVTVSGAISIGSAGLTKDGTGTLTLSNANTYSGATAVNAGVVNIQNGSALGSSSQTTIADGASLQLQGGIAVGSLVLRLNGAGVSSLGALRNISGNNSWSGTITALSASRIHSDAGVLTLSGANAISATNMGVTFGGSGDVVVSGTITTGTGTLTKEGSGTLTLSGANTYTGATTITSGTVVLGNSQVIANTSNVVMNGGTLNTNSFTETVGQLLLQNNSTLALGSGVHTLTFSSAGTFSFKRLTITGWQGNYGGAGSPGTAGRIFIGSGAVVSREQLDQIQFTDGTATYYAIQLSDGELVPGANTSTVPTGNSNVQVTTLATAGGSWSGGTSGPYVFTPNADNANILYTDIEYRLLGYNGFTRGNVRIVTTNGTGTQVGNVNIATLITAANQQSTAYTFTVDAAGDINVS
ncbi:MAG: beta strand repeat-containing protein, partial [Bacteroidota bacterium]